MKYRALHKWNVTPKEAFKIQKNLLKKLSLKNSLRKINTLAAVDVSYKDGKSKCSIYVVKYPDLSFVECRVATLKTGFPYVPGLLSFREGPAVLKCIRKLKTKPSVFLFDGQGIAHPRMMGLATHIGIILNTPSVGCAKSFLYGSYKGSPGIKKGSFVYIKAKDKVIGAILRSKDKTKPIYVSPGNKVDLKTSIKVVLKCLTKYRIPDPLRLAHQNAKL